MNRSASLRLLLLVASAIESSLLSAQTSMVRGVVVDNAMKPLSNATVYALPAEDMAKPILAKADKDGRFELDNLPPGFVYLDADKKSDGYPYSLFSFYISPGQDKPNILVRPDETSDDVVIKMGERVAYLKLTITNTKGEEVPAGFLFSRPDIPDHRGDMSLSVSTHELIPVLAVPFSFEVKSDGYQVWKYRRPDGSALISLKPLEVLKLEIKLMAVPEMQR